MSTQYLLIIISIMFYIPLDTIYITGTLITVVEKSDGQETGKFWQLGGFQKKCWIEN